jgi:dihydroxyacetone kinase
MHISKEVSVTIEHVFFFPFKVDALMPALKILQKPEKGENPKTRVIRAAKAALEGARRTRSMKPKVGRGAYVSADMLQDPDAGAIAVAIWMHAIAQSLR